MRRCEEWELVGFGIAFGIAFLQHLQLVKVA